jgi:DNA-binding protein YbaB
VECVQERKVGGKGCTYHFFLVTVAGSLSMRDVEIYDAGTDSKEEERLRREKEHKQANCMVSISVMGERECQCMCVSETRRPRATKPPRSLQLLIIEKQHI